MTTETSSAGKALLIVPHLYVQHANAISSPLTWGFPAVTAFTGLMTALARRLGPDSGIGFLGVGVICHHFEPQVTRAGYVHSFSLVKPSIASSKELTQYLTKGTLPSIVEDGRAHLEITLVFDVEIAASLRGETARAALAAEIGELIAGMRIAGGSVMPSRPGSLRRPSRARLELLAGDEQERRAQFRRLARRWLPGFALVSRDGLLQSHLAEMRQREPHADLLDAWLDMSRLNLRAQQQEHVDTETGEIVGVGKVAWQVDRRPGWIVPIPVGFASLEQLQRPGHVANARDPRLPFRFVESVYSLGQWISPHRLEDVSQLTWTTLYDSESGLYRCINAFESAPVVARAD